MILLNGKDYRKELLEEYKEIITKNNYKIELDIILVGNDNSSNLYVKNKVKYCNMVGITTKVHQYEKITEEKLIELIIDLNNSKTVNGIILQSPVPNNIDFDYVSGLIDPKKDIDGFTKENIYNLYLNKPSLIPCTSKGILKLLQHYNIDVKNKNIVILGNDYITSRPLSLLLINKGANVTICNTISEITKDADILISNTGIKQIIKEDMVKEGFIGVDVGCYKEKDKIVGDFDFENIKDKASYITPVPGGVGPMTISMIIDNLIYTKKTNKTKKLIKKTY